MATEPTDAQLVQMGNSIMSQARLRAAKIVAIEFKDSGLDLTAATPEELGQKITNALSGGGNQEAAREAAERFRELTLQFYQEGLLPLSPETQKKLSRRVARRVVSPEAYQRLLERGVTEADIARAGIARRPIAPLNPSAQGRR